MKSEKTIMGLIARMGLIGLMGLMGLVAACTSEPVVEAAGEAAGEAVEKPAVERPSVPVEGVMGFMSGFDDYVPNRFTWGVTRAWNPPSGYEHYADGEKAISVFFTQTSGEPVGGYEEEFFFKSGDKWRVSKTDLEADGIYYLYGYAPHNNDANVTATIGKLSGEGKTYAHGAVLTLRNLPTAMSSDPCVIIGAKNGREYYRENEDYTVDPLVRGDFAYEAQSTGEGGTGGNYVFLLFDHLFASLDISMRVHSDYDALRTIKLKELHLQTKVGEETTKKKTDVTITLESGPSANDPIKSVEFDASGYADAEDTNLNIVQEGGVKLSTTLSDFVGYFMPQGVTTIVLTSIYDVYDKDTSVMNPDGNLIRQNCTATNTLELNKLYYSQYYALRGKKYHVTMTIQPTYLYQMSDPDLDNPTVKIDN